MKGMRESRAILATLLYHGVQRDRALCLLLRIQRSLKPPRSHAFFRITGGGSKIRFVR